MKRKSLREKFERWYTRRYHWPPDRMGDGYYPFVTQARWEGYRAGHAQGRKL